MKFGKKKGIKVLKLTWSVSLSKLAQGLEDEIGRSLKSGHGN